MTSPESPRRLLLLLAANFGFVFLARTTVGLLAPFMTGDLALDSMRLGLQAAATDLSWAVSGLATTLFVSRQASAPRLLVLLTAFCACAELITGLAQSFVMLLAARVLTGAVSGPVLPLSQALLNRASSAARRGLNMGLVQSVGGSLIAAILGPPLLVSIAERYGWRASCLFCVAALLATMLALHLMLSPRQRPGMLLQAESQPQEPPSLRIIAASRNIRICAAISLVMVAWLVCGLAFYPSHMVRALGYSPEVMGRLMSLFGVSSLTGGLLLPWLSDRHGRRRVIAAAAALGAAAPLAMAVHANQVIVVLAFIATGLAGGTFPLFMSIIPAESLVVRDVAAGIGLVQCAGELLGGIVAPVCAGFLGARFGPESAMLLIACCAMVASVLTVGIVETAPVQRSETR